MLSPSDVLRMQVDLAEALASPSSFTSESLDGLAHSQGKQPAGDHTTSRYAMHHARTARAYQVTADMGRVVMNRFASLEHIPGTAHCPTDIAPPRTCGLVVMEDPIPYRDIRNCLNLIHVLTWGPGTANRGHFAPVDMLQTAFPLDSRGHLTGWVLTAWNDTAREADDISKLLRTEYTALGKVLSIRWWPCTTLFLPRDMRLGSPTWPVTDADRERADATADKTFLAMPPTATGIPNLHRYWAALWQLFTEERGPAIAEETHPQRPALRLARRVLQTSDITVITLRKRPGAHTGTGVPLDHQVPVTQHYRGYWCTGRACTCAQPVAELHLEKRLIGEHLRGPHGTRLIVRKKMERLSR